MEADAPHTSVLMALPDLHYKGTGWYQHADGRFCQWFRDREKRPARKQITLQESDMGLAYEEARENARRWKNGDFDPWRPWNGGAITLKEAADKWVDYCDREGMSPHTVRERRLIMRAFSGGRGGVDVSRISPGEVRSFCRAPHLASSTQRGYYAKLNTFFRWCQGQGYRRDNPASSVNPPKEKKGPPVYMTKEEFRSFVRMIETDCIVGRKGLNEGALIWSADVFRWAVLTGMRAAEITHLRWRDVDLGRRRVYVREWKERGKARRHRTKSGHERSIPLFASSVDVLSRRMAARTSEDTAELVFKAYRGGKINAGHLSKIFRQYRDRANLRPEIHFHTLRHTFASWLVSDGVPIAKVQRWLGHASVSQTEIYAHLIEDEHDDVASRVMTEL